VIMLQDPWESGFDFQLRVKIFVVRYRAWCPSRGYRQRDELSLRLLPPFTPRKIPDTHFCYRLSRLQGHSTAGRIKSIEKYSDLIWNRTLDLPACSYRVELYLHKCQGS
jgi:hypothetical protein